MTNVEMRVRTGQDVAGNGWLLFPNEMPLMGGGERKEGEEGTGWKEVPFGGEGTTKMNDEEGQFGRNKQREQEQPDQVRAYCFFIITTIKGKIRFP